MDGSHSNRWKQHYLFLCFINPWSIKQCHMDLIDVVQLALQGAQVCALLTRIDIYDSFFFSDRA